MFAILAAKMTLAAIFPALIPIMVIFEIIRNVGVNIYKVKDEKSQREVWRV